MSERVRVYKLEGLLEVRGDEPGYEDIAAALEGLESVVGAYGLFLWEVDVDPRPSLPDYFVPLSAIPEKKGVTPHELDVLNLSARVRNALRSRSGDDYITIRDLHNSSDDQLFAIRGIGEGAVAEIRAAVKVFANRVVEGEFPPQL